MNKYIKTTKYLIKPILATPLISKLSTEANKHAKLCLDETTRLFFINNSLIKHYQKSLIVKPTTISGKIQNKNRKVPEESVEAVETIRFF